MPNRVDHKLHRFVLRVLTCF